MCNSESILTYAYSSCEEAELRFLARFVWSSFRSSSRHSAERQCRTARSAGPAAGEQLESPVPLAAARPACRAPRNMAAGQESCPDGRHGQDPQQKYSVRTSREVHGVTPKGVLSLRVLLSPCTGHRCEVTEIYLQAVTLAQSQMVDLGERDRLCPFLQPHCLFPALPLHEAVSSASQHRTAVHLHQ